MKFFFVGHKNTIFVIAIIVLSFLLGFLYLGKKDLSLDEIATALIVRDWSQMIHILTFTENNMWLYYVLLHFWQIFGTNELALRSLSVIFGCISIPVIYLLGKKIFDTKVAAITILLTSLNVFFISNEQNARAYSLVLLLTSLSSYYFIKCVSDFLKTKKINKKYFIFILLFNVLGVYAHLYTLFVIASQAVSLLFTHQRKLIKSLLISLPITGVLLLPLAFAPSLSGQPTNWIPVPDIRNLIGTFLILSDDFPPIALIYIVFFLGLFTVLWRKRKKISLFDSSYWYLKYLFIWLLLPIILSFIFSIFVKPLYISMYFFICLVPFTLIVSHMITKLKSQWIQNTIIASLLLFSVIRLYGWYSNNVQLQLVISNSTEDWRGVANFLATQTQPNDGILFFPPFVQENVDYYLQKNNLYLNKGKEINLQPDIYAGGSGYEEFDGKSLNTIPYHYQRLWYVYGIYTDSAIAQEEKEINTMLAKNYTIERTINFYDITVYLYSKK